MPRVRKTLKKVKKIQRRLKAKPKSIISKAPRRAIKKVTRGPKVYRKANKVYKKLKAKPRALARSVAKKTSKKVVKAATKSTKKLSNKLIKSLIRENSKLNERGLDKLTKKQLSEYITSSVQLINESSNTMNKASRKALKETMQLMGEGKVKGTLGLNIEGDKKLDLLEKARVLKAVISGDGVSDIALIRRNMQTYKAFKSFKKGATGQNLEDLTFGEYNDLVRVAGRVQAILGPRAGSDPYQLFENLFEYRNTIGMDRVGDIMLEEIKKSKEKGLDVKKVTRKITARLQKELKNGIV